MSKTDKQQHLDFHTFLIINNPVIECLYNGSIHIHRGTLKSKPSLYIYCDYDNQLGYQVATAWKQMKFLATQKGCPEILHSNNCNDH